MGEIRVLIAFEARYFASTKPIARRRGIGDNGGSGWRFRVKDEDRSMPPFIAFAGVLGGLAAVRWVYKTAQRINEELEEARLSRMADAVRTAEIPTLRRDPVTGAYRPG
jgi:hypothetical protein